MSNDDYILMLSGLIDHFRRVSVDIYALRTALMTGDKLVIDAYDRYYTTRRDLSTKRGEIGGIHYETCSIICDIIKEWRSEHRK